MLHDPEIFRAIAIKQGLSLYARTGLKPNRAWTPTNMLRTAGHITGHVYKRGQYELAISDLQYWLDCKRESAGVGQTI